ncbi:MAG: type II toxin-antitoxin system death-on-curing family toxin [Bacillota bacterium]
MRNSPPAKECVYLSRDWVIIAHIALVDWSQGGRPTPPRAVRFDLLESAINLPKQQWYEGIYIKSAALFRSLIQNHPFLDGNKRTAIVALDVFLGLNGYEFKAKKKDMVEFALKTAKGEVKDLGEIAEWIRKRSRKRSFIQEVKWYKKIFRKIGKRLSE